MTYIYRINARTAVGFVENLVNTLNIVDTTVWGALTPVIDVSIVAPTGAVIYSETGLAKNFTSVFSIAVDVDGNIIQGTYTVNTVWDGNVETTSFLVDYNPLSAALEATGDGYASTFSARDNTDYTGWSSVVRSLKVVCPVGSGMPDATTTGTLITIAPNIWSGDYVVSVNCNFRLVVGSLTIYDGFVDSITETVEAINVTSMFTAINTYFDEYVTLLSTAPKTAQARLPEIIKVHSALHSYYKYVTDSDTLNAYLQAVAIYDLIGIASVDEEIAPFNITSNTHTHTNLNSVLALFENEGGDLLWNGVVIPLGESLGKVAMSNGDTPEFLEDKIDDVTIENTNGELAVKEAYIASLAGTNITYDSNTKKFNATADDFPVSYVQWIEGRTYYTGDIVRRGIDGLDYYFRALQENALDPADQGTPQGNWEFDTTTTLRHTQNTDLYIPYVTSSRSAATLGSVISGKAGFDLSGAFNRFVWTKTGAGNEVIETIILPNTKADVVLTIKPTGAGSVTLKNTGSTYSFTGQLDLQGDDIVISTGEEYTFTFYAHLDQAAYVTQIKSTTIRGEEGATPAGAEGDIQLNVSSALGVAAGGVGKYAGSGAWTLGQNRLGAVGANSFVCGQDNTASGASATALGYSNTASGASSVAAGRSNQATGSSATAIGGANVVSGVRASALGYTNTVSGDYSVATGSNNSVLGTYCEAGGDNNTINVGDSYTEVHGAQNIALNTDYSEIHGRQNQAIDAGYTEVHGWNNYTEYSYGEIHGVGNEVYANYAEVHGYGAVASEAGERTRALGYFTEVGDAQKRTILLRGTESRGATINMSPLNNDGAYGITIPERASCMVDADFVWVVDDAVEPPACYNVKFWLYESAGSLTISDLVITGGDFGVGGTFDSYFTVTSDGVDLQIILISANDALRFTLGIAEVKILQVIKQIGI